MFPCPSSLLEFAQTHVHWVSDAIQPSHLRSHHSYPASIFPSIRVFSNESAPLIRRAKYWSVNFSICSSNGYSGLISLRTDWFDLFAVQGTLERFLQHHRWKASILWCSAFYMVQQSHPYLTTGKTALTVWTLIGKVVSLLFNILSRFVIAFLAKSKCPLISWPQYCPQWLWSPRKENL